MLFMHVYRFSHGGKVCSGDYLPSDERVAQDFYLIARGALMYEYICAFWTILGIILVAGIGAIIFALKSLT